MTPPSVFMRKEEKYLLPIARAHQLLASLGAHLTPDAASANTAIDNLYLDTASDLLIRRSIEKPDYKEKLRIRSYGYPSGGDADNPVFLELKKKYLGTVYKRRVSMSYGEAQEFVTQGVMPRSPLRGSAEKIALNQQILDELSRALEMYHPLQPAIRLDYRRAAFTYRGDDGSELRMTLDTDLRWARGAWRDDGQRRDLLACDEGVLEIKIVGTMPRHLARSLGALGIFPRSFSKVGCAYEQAITKGLGDYHARGNL